MPTLSLPVSHSPSRWAKAVTALYDTHRRAIVFEGSTPAGERVALFVAPDGSAFGAIDAQPDALIRYAEALLSRPDADPSSCSEPEHPGVSEGDFPPGSFDPKAQVLSVSASLELL